MVYIIGWCIKMEILQLYKKYVSDYKLDTIIVEDSVYLKDPTINPPDGDYTKSNGIMAAFEAFEDSNVFCFNVKKSYKGTINVN